MAITRSRNDSQKTIGEKIDDNFKQDMFNECEKHKDTFRIKWTECRVIAEAYYSAVSLCGGGECS